jgi:hypothetical protein
MPNKSENDVIVGGFAFAEEEMAKQAQKELDGVAYVRGKADMDNPRMVLQIYNKMVEQQLFETVVGYVYLKELQDYLTSIPFIDQDAILAIPVPAPASSESGRGAGKKIKLKQQKKDEPNREKERVWELRAKILAGVCITLALCVVGMFIVQTTAGSTNILNYENELINKYETWEEQLEEREAAIEELEREKGISTQGESKED